MEALKNKSIKPSMKKFFNIRVFFLVSFLLILFSSSAFAAVVVRTGSDAEIFPAGNGNMHILIRNNHSSYLYYSSEGIIKELPLEVSAAPVLFETAFSDGQGGVYVLYNNTANKTLYVQRFNSNGDALWDAGAVVDSYTDSIAFAMSELTPAGDFIVVYDKYTPPTMLPWGNYYGCLRAISPDGIVSSPAGDGEFYHSLDMEMHHDQNALYIRKWPASYITQIMEGIEEAADTLNSNILAFDCDDRGFLFGIRQAKESGNAVELYRFNDQLHAAWETPVVFNIGISKTLSEPVYPRPEIIANKDGSVTLYPGRLYGDPAGIGVARIDSLGEYLYRNLDLAEILAAFADPDAANLFLLNTTLSDGETNVVRLVKVSVSGDIIFSSILRYGHLSKGSIIKNTDGSYATAMVYANTLAIDKLSSSGEILLAIEENIIPVQFSLQQNYPNPFNPSTCICVELPESGELVLDILDIRGRVVDHMLMNKSAGMHEIPYAPKQLSTGIYFIRARFKDRIQMQKIMYLK